MPNLTLEEIARLSGVSRSTVSRVVNRQPNVSEKVRQRVRSVIEETGYQPNLAARSLASQRSRIIGLVIPRTVHAFFTDPYFPRLTQGIAQACNQYNYTLSLFLFHTTEDERRLFPRISGQGFLDGIIVQAPSQDDQLLSQISKGSIPFIVAGRPTALEGDMSYIDVDNVAGAYTAVTHLIQIGRRRIATITGPLNSSPGVDRKKGYLKALMDRGLPLKDELIFEGDFTQISGQYGAKKLLQHKPDAIFAASDNMAAGAIRAIREHGFKVPGDVAVVGYDDLPPAKYSDPSLTTIRQPVLRFGIKAVETLIDILENGTVPPRRILFDTELIIRDSCGAGKMEVA